MLLSILTRVRLCIVSEMFIRSANCRKQTPHPRSQLGLILLVMSLPAHQSNPPKKRAQYCYLCVFGYRSAGHLQLILYSESIHTNNSTPSLQLKKGFKELNWCTAETLKQPVDPVNCTDLTFSLSALTAYCALSQLQFQGYPKYPSTSMTSVSMQKPHLFTRYPWLIGIACILYGGNGCSEINFLFPSEVLVYVYLYR